MEAEREGDKNIVTGVELPAVIKSEEARGEVEKNAELEEKRKEWVIDVKRPSSSSSSSASNGGIGGEKECRICHLSREEEEENHNLMELGCACKGELGVSHLSCAQTWFKLKGNRSCEICGKQARNVTGVEEEGRISMLDWTEVRLMTRRNTATTFREEEEDDLGRCRHGFCNTLLVCLFIAFIFPWIYRISML
ncbi:hypothetical protein LguiB_002221 [Lonicera macranthoides]